MEPVPDADAIVDRIDAGLFAPTYHPVVRAICNHLRLDDADRELLTLIDKRAVQDVDERLNQLWDRITSRPVEQEGIPRLLTILLLADQSMDWFATEMVIHWARQEGLPEAEICKAFGFEMSPNS